MDVSLDKLRKRRGFNEVLALCLLFLAFFFAVALATYDSDDPTWFHRRPDGQAMGNRMGRVGASFSELLLQLFGLPAFLLPVFLVAAAWNRFRDKARISYGRILSQGVLLLSLCALMDLAWDRDAYGGEVFHSGGYLGDRLGGLLTTLMGSVGGLGLAALILAGAIVLTTRFSFARAGSAVSGMLAGAGRRIASRWSAFVENRRRAAQKRAVIKKHARQAAAVRSDAKPGGAEPATEASPRASIPVPQEGEPTAPKVSRPQEAKPPKLAAPPPPAPLPLRRGEPAIALPPLELLNDPVPHEGEDEKELLGRARQITEKLREFDLEGSVVAVHPGPVVTTFEFKPEAGVKYSRVTGLVDDLCLALKAESIRIDRLPGRSTIGIEVPNRKQETIFPKELIGSERFRSARSKLTLALGKDISGEVFTAELDRMPHLLIAGATGAGKSVGLNGMIASVLYKATPADVRFILIDTKMIELGVYQDIPHLLVPVVTDPKAASTALKWAVREMEQRYRKLASTGVRNIEQFNTLLESEPDRTMQDERTGEAVPLRHLPYIVIVIDEMADLMMTTANDVEESIMRLAQMARAVGIHMILATQRPSVDVITGTIKANFPARVAYRVSQKVDSRTIIDQGGADKLLGRGDMLFLPSGSSRLIRVHGGFITENEINRVTAFLKKQAKPVYDESVLKEPEEERPGHDLGERDPMFLEAVRVVLQEGQCSITLIQRRLRLGYARAARIVDMMEQEGIIGPADGSKPREVLVGPEIITTLEASP
jgi:S-DNA-T family DNA segregation ATPase FtsK/SpoIIIE